MTKNQTKDTNTKKTKRGRPASKFTIQKPYIKRDTPGRPKKVTKPILPEIPKEKNNKTKDIIILILFIFSVLIFIFSIYVNKQNKKLAINHEYSTIYDLIQYQAEGLNPSEDLQTHINETSNIDSEDIKNSEDMNFNKNTKINVNTFPTSNSDDPKFIILQNIYSEIQKSNFDTLYQNTNTKLKNGQIFKKYFSRARLQRFINNIENLDISFISTTDNTVYYQSNYFVNGQLFIEDREASFDDETKINKITCHTTGCSTLPFFNPGKYF